MKSKINRVGDRIEFWCAPCNTIHAINGGWQWNGSETAPTFTPSVLVRSGHYGEQYKVGDSCWCTYNAARPAEDKVSFKCYLCHSYVTDGKIQYLNDCSHDLKGQTIELPNWEESGIQ